MKKEYVVKVYHGYDCNSYDGFNNGCYLDSMSLMAENESQAIIRAMARFRKENGNYKLLKQKKAHDSFFHRCSDEQGFYLEHDDFTDKNGDSIDDIENFDGESFYSYEFITFSLAETV